MVPYCTKAGTTRSTFGVASVSVIALSSVVIRLTCTRLSPAGNVEDDAAEVSSNGSSGTCSTRGVSITTTSVWRGCGTGISKGDDKTGASSATSTSSGSAAGVVDTVISCSFAGTCGAMDCGLGSTGSSAVASMFMAGVLFGAVNVSETPDVCGTSADAVSANCGLVSTVGAETVGVEILSTSGAIIVGGTSCGAVPAAASACTAFGAET